MQSAPTYSPVSHVMRQCTTFVVTLCTAFVTTCTHSIVAAQTTPTSDFELGEKGVLPLLITSPGGIRARCSSSALLRITEALFGRYTDFRSALIDDAVIKECETRLPCVLSRIQSERAQTAYVALLSNVSQPNRGDLLTMWLIDVERAHALRSTDEARWEERIFSEAIVVQSVRAEVSGEAEAERVLHQLFFGPVRKALEPKDHWLPFGSLLLQLPNTNFEIRIDDHPIHLNTRTTWRIGAIRPGTRRVTLTHPDFLPWQGELRIQKQVESTLQPELIPRADPRLARQVVGDRKSVV